MSKYKLPIRCLFRPTITQPYGDKTYLDFYKSMGVNIPFHQGLDLGIGSSKQTYGTPLVCPFTKAVVKKVTFDTAQSTRGNGIRIEYKMTDSVSLEIVLWHMSNIVVKEGQEVIEGQVLGNIGNSGINGKIRPGGVVATNGDINDPWEGAHVHFELYLIINGVIQYINNGVNGAIDPLLFFSNDFFYGVYNKEVDDFPATIQYLKNLDLLGALKQLMRWGFRF